MQEEREELATWKKETLMFCSRGEYESKVGVPSISCSISQKKEKEFPCGYYWPKVVRDQ